MKIQLPIRVIVNRFRKKLVERFAMDQFHHHENL